MTDSFDALPEEQRSQKIQSLRDMITSAERTIHGAKAMLLQIEGKKKVGRKKKVDEEDGQVIQGTFDGQVMIGTDGKQYPVPANYASKSKLVEGDLLKLTISPEGFFIYKQLGPVPRQNKIGIVGQDTSGNYFIDADSKNYRVLLASVTYFKAEPGDEVAIVTAQGDDVVWASIESVLQHNHIDVPARTASLSDLPTEKPVTASGIIAGQDAAPSTMSDITREIVEDEEIVIESEDLAQSTTVDEEQDNSILSQTVISPAQEIDVAQNFPVDVSHLVASPIADTASMESPTTVENIVTPLANPYGETTVQTIQKIVDEWVPDIDEIEREIRAEMGIAQSTQ